MITELTRDETTINAAADAVEALLFVAPAPVSIAELSEAMGASEDEVSAGIDYLTARLKEFGGLQVAKIAGGYQLCTKTQFAEAIANLLKPQKKRLGRSALEVMAIIAYKQPITALEIFLIRGVQSDYSLKVLIDLGLIQELERKQAPGRPILYGTTQQFLHQFNLNELSDLPEVQGALPLA